MVAHGKTRAEATAKLRGALDAFYIKGPSHNIAFLAALLANPRFAEGRLSTNFIAEEFPDGFTGGGASPKAVTQSVLLAGAVQRVLAERDARMDGQLSGTPGTPPENWVACLGKDRYPLHVTRAAETIAVEYDGKSHAIKTDWLPGQPILRCVIDQDRLIFQIGSDGVGFTLTHGGTSFAFKVLTPRAAELLARMPEKRPPDLSRYLLSPMPGLLVSLAVTEGHEVKAGDVLAVVEAMKMENVLRAERDGKIKSLSAKAGDSLAVDQIILEFS